ncbi:MAG: thioredoxin family protein [Deltaproteobacteria bacterium]|nr:thioredoxin family protein [Deltaproteobacteria bacterium]
MFKVELLGTGGECNLLASEVLRASQFVGIPVKLVRVEQPEQIAARGVATTPALIIDGAIRCQGVLPTQAELTSWLTTAALKYETA